MYLYYNKHLENAHSFIVNRNTRALN